MTKLHGMSCAGRTVRPRRWIRQRSSGRVLVEVRPGRYGATIAILAACMLAAEPFPKGAVLFSLTESHGVDAGDLPTLVLLVLAGWLAR
jgi:hypothetical protein